MSSKNIEITSSHGAGNRAEHHPACSPCFLLSFIHSRTKLSHSRVGRDIVLGVEAFFFFFWTSKLKLFKGMNTTWLCFYFPTCHLWWVSIASEMQHALLEAPWLPNLGSWSWPRCCPLPCGPLRPRGRQWSHEGLLQWSLTSFLFLLVSFPTPPQTLYAVGKSLGRGSDL